MPNLDRDPQLQTLQLKDNGYGKNLKMPLIAQNEKRQRDRVAWFQNFQAWKLRKEKNRYLNKARKGEKNGATRKEKGKVKRIVPQKLQGLEIQAQRKWGRHQKLRSSEKDVKMARSEKVEKKTKSF